MVVPMCCRCFVFVCALGVVCLFVVVVEVVCVCCVLLLIVASRVCVVSSLFMLRVGPFFVNWCFMCCSLLRVGVGWLSLCVAMIPCFLLFCVWRVSLLVVRCSRVATYGGCV